MVIDKTIIGFGSLTEMCMKFASIINKEELQCFPQIWLMKLEDVFDIFDKKMSNIQDFISLLSNRFLLSQFAFERG